MGGLSQAEIDAVQESRRRKEAAGGGHPSFQGENKGLFQEATSPALLSSVDYGPENLQFDPRAGGTNVYDDHYRRALATFQQGTPLQQEEIIGRMQLGQQAGQAHRAMRGAGPLGAAAGMRPLVQQQLGTAAQMGQARGQREMAQKATLGRSIQQAGQVDIAKAASETARLQAITDFKRRARLGAEAADQASRSQWAMLAAQGVGEAEDWYNRDPMQTYDV